MDIKTEVIENVETIELVPQDFKGNTAVPSDAAEGAETVQEHPAEGEAVA